jgi:hypothetical protein
MMGLVAMLEGMGLNMRVFSERIEEPEGRQRLVKVQQRFAGFKGAVRSAMYNATSQIVSAK